jgi:hypothetical protein
MRGRKETLLTCRRKEAKTRKKINTFPKIIRCVFSITGFRKYGKRGIIMKPSCFGGGVSGVIINVRRSNREVFNTSFIQIKTKKTFGLLKWIN